MNVLYDTHFHCTNFPSLDHHDIDTTVLSKPNVDEESEIITKANYIKNQVKCLIYEYNEWYIMK